MYIEYPVKENKAGNQDKGILEEWRPTKGKKKSTLGLYEPQKLNKNGKNTFRRKYIRKRKCYWNVYFLRHKWFFDT